MPVTSPEKSDLLTATEAGAEAGVSGETIRRLAQRGEIPVARRVGRMILVRREDVQAWVKRREEGQNR